MAFSGFEVDGEFTDERWVKVYIDFDRKWEAEKFFDNVDGNPEFGHELEKLVERFLDDGEERK